MKVRIFSLLVALLLVGCGERKQVQSYLTAISTEVPSLQKIGKGTERAFDDLRFGKKPRKLKELASRLKSVRQELDEQVTALQASRDRIAAIPAPQPAKELEIKLLSCYDQWLGVGKTLSGICEESEQACLEIDKSPAKGKWKRFVAAVRDIGDELRALGKDARDAKEASEEVGKELQRLQKKYKVVANS